MKNVRAHLIISGVVQGVFYRASTRDTAVRLGLKGWVRNLPDGNVEAVFEGSLQDVDSAVEWCRQGPPGAYIDRIKEKPDRFTGEFSDFRVIY